MDANLTSAANCPMAEKRTSLVLLLCLSIHSFKVNPRPHAKSIYELFRIHDRIVLGFETALVLILQSLRDLKFMKFAFSSLTELVAGGDALTFLVAYNKSQKRSPILFQRGVIARTSLGPRANTSSVNAI